MGLVPCCVCCMRASGHLVPATSCLSLLLLSSDVLALASHAFPRGRASLSARQFWWASQARFSWLVAVCFRCDIISFRFPSMNTRRTSVESALIPDGQGSPRSVLFVSSTGNWAHNHGRKEMTRMVHDLCCEGARIVD